MLSKDIRNMKSKNLDGEASNYEQEHEIINIIDNSPAQKVGLQEEDIIVSINNEDVREKTVDELVNLIKNSENNVIIEIERNNEYLEYTIDITTLFVPSVQYNMIDNTNIGYLKMSVFSNHLTEETVSALDKLEQNGMNKLIIDLRNNTPNSFYLLANYLNIFDYGRNQLRKLYEE